MKRSMILGLAALFFGVVASSGEEKETRVFELRVYTPVKGKQSDVNNLIAKSGVKLMTKHQIQLVGAWVPVSSEDERVFTLVVHKDKATADKNWAAFQADEEWKSDVAKATKDGKTVESLARFFLSATDYSPAVKATEVGDRVFELRTYAATPKNLPALNSRFRDHTTKLFATHGMTNVAYFNFLEGEKTTGVEMLKALSPLGKEQVDVKEDTDAKSIGLVYFLSHKSPQAAQASFNKFRLDETWKKVAADSEKAAGGSLTVKGGVKSLFLKATEYSPLK